MGPGRLVRPHQWLRFRISGGEDLPGKAEVCLCAGAKLLFLPRRPGSLPHRLSPGGDGQRKVSGVLLRVRLPDPLWHLPGAVRLRMAVPLRVGAGSAAPDPHFPQEKESAGPQRPGLSEIWGAGPVCADPAGHGGSDGHRHGGTLVLQVHLSQRDSAGGTAPAGGKSELPLRGGSALWLEVCRSAGGGSPVGEILPPLLQVSLSPGGCVRMVQPHRPVPAAGG